MKPHGGTISPTLFFSFCHPAPLLLKFPDIWGVAHCKIPDFPAFDRFTVLSRFEGATFCWKALWIFKDFMGFYGIFGLAVGFGGD